MIIERGRGPEIAGSRITVYDVLAETQAGATPEELAEWYGLSVDQIAEALRYIDDHRADVLAKFAVIQERHAKGNSPEVSERIAESRRKLRAMKAALTPNLGTPAEPGHAGVADGR